MNASAVAHLLAEHYGISCAVEVTTIVCGPASNAWRVDVRGDRRSYCLKEHRPRTIERLNAEHRLMRQMHEGGFLLAPQVMAGTAGDTVVSEGTSCYSLYRFIESDAPFNWTLGGWSLEQARLAGAALAEFHVCAGKCVERWTGTTDAFDPTQRDAVAQWALGILQRASGMFPDDVMVCLSNFEDLLRSAFIICGDRRYHGPIHGDFHPGNVLYLRQELVAVLDFEYCRIDSRLFDVAYAVMTFSFEQMDPAFGLALLNAYNESALKSGYFDNFVALEISGLQPLIALSAWLSALWLIEQCQRGSAVHDEALPVLRKCIAILSATLD